jgi:hypothetical protein
MMVAFCITLMFCIGDEEAVANSILPITEVFYSATGSKTASTAMTMMMGFELMIGNFNIVASVARLVWRFASDKGLPFHQHFTYVGRLSTPKLLKPAQTNTDVDPPHTPSPTARTLPRRRRMLPPFTDQSRFGSGLQLAHLAPHNRTIHILPRAHHAPHGAATRR